MDGMAGGGTGVDRICCHRGGMLLRLMELAADVSAGSVVMGRNMPPQEMPKIEKHSPV